MTSIFSVADAQQRARRVLPRAVFDYVDGGADDEITIRANRQAFEDVTFRPRMAVYVKPDLRTTVFGVELKLPVLSAPCGLVRVVHPDGEIGVARAAGAAGTISIVSTAAGTALEEVATGSGANLWFQLYFMGGRDGAEVLVRRAQAAGYSALVVTVDTAVSGRRERDIRNGIQMPIVADARTALRFAPQLARRPGWLLRFARDGMPLDFPNAARLGPHGSASTETDRLASLISLPPTWADIEWIRTRWDGPLIVKGVLTGDDARHAVTAGADGVVVSNHGGRQLDGAPASLRVLPEVVGAVGGEAEVFLDSGVRRGSDVAKAVALGARAVLIGRAYLYGLAAGGEAGVGQVLRVFRGELDRTLRLIGCASVRELDRSWVRAPW